jgi:hypothetical protein
MDGRIQSPGAASYGLKPSGQELSRYRMMAASELGQLRAWQNDPRPARTKIDDQGGVILDADDPAEAVLIVCHPVLNGELLGWRSRGRDIEGTCRQGAPGGGAGRLHHHQYAPLTLTITAAR